ncbi:MAG: AAA family ATPase [Nanoarchaeota archaeon]|nr:AAA family ATPase [Nanoarchaeota archaeon]
MKSSKELKVRWPNSISISDSGKGKTFFIGTMTKHHKIYLIDTERGSMTIKDKNFDYEIVDTFKELEREVYWYFDNYKKHGYTMLVIDSISRLQQYLVDELLDKENNNSKNKSYKLDFDQWAEILARLRKLVDVLTKKLPTPIHMTVMAGESKDQLTKINKVYPNIQGAFKHDLLGYFDVVLYHDCGEGKNGQTFWVQTQGDQRIIAKSRLQGLNKIEKNSYDCIARIMNKEK